MSPFYRCLVLLLKHKMSYSPAMAIEMRIEMRCNEKEICADIRRNQKTGDIGSFAE